MSSFTTSAHQIATLLTDTIGRKGGNGVTHGTVSIFLSTGTSNLKIESCFTSQLGTVMYSRFFFFLDDELLVICS